MDEFLKPSACYDRLLAEYRKYGSLTCGVDFDGTLHDYHKTGASHEMVRQLVRDLKEIGCTIICWTAYPDLEYVKNFLTENNIPFDGVNEGAIKLPWDSKKPFFSCLIDDRAGIKEVYAELSLLVKTIRNER